MTNVTVGVRIVIDVSFIGSYSSFLVLKVHLLVWRFLYNHFSSVPSWNFWQNLANTDLCLSVLSFWMCLVFGLILPLHLLPDNISEKDTVIVRVSIMCEKSFWCPRSLPPITTVFLRAEPILLFVKAFLAVEVERDTMPSWKHPESLRLWHRRNSWIDLFAVIFLL